MIECKNCGNWDCALCGTTARIMHCSKRQTYMPKPMTGAEKVRIMTDEELEEWYWWMHKKMMEYTDSHIFVHNWLKQEV